ncbi:MAG TPA: metallophosphoesterase [Salinivirgaceae bacterium]|nr:metallophosphoesterase [Salinivirgaceae bacterium]
MRLYLPWFTILAAILAIDVAYYFFLKRLKQKPFYQKIQTFSLCISIIYLLAFSLLFLISPIRYDSSAFNFYRPMSWAVTWFMVWYLPRIIMLLLFPLFKIFSFKRREILLHNVMIFIAMLSFAGVFLASFTMIYRNQKISHGSIPQAFNGYRIVQISDIHLYSQTLSKQLWKKRVEEINSLKPDLIVFTGDVVNNFWIETQGWDSVFSGLKARDGKFAILGNHDYGDYTRWKTTHDKFINFQRIQSFLKKNGFRLLNNQHHFLVKQHDTLVLAGIENWGNPPFPRYGDLEKALLGVNRQLPMILLSHDSDFWDAEVLSSPWKIILTLSGHTHGFQFGLRTRWLSFSPSQWRYKRWGGLYQLNSRYLYVSTGIGTVAYLGRVGILPETVVFELFSE